MTMTEDSDVLLGEDAFAHPIIPTGTIESLTANAQRLRPPEQERTLPAFNPDAVDDDIAFSRRRPRGKRCRPRHNWPTNWTPPVYFWDGQHWQLIQEKSCFRCGLTQIRRIH